MNRDYFQEALHRFNTDKPNWYGWKKIDDDGNTIPNKDRMQHKYIKVIVDGATIPSEADVNAMIQTIKDENRAKIEKKTSGKQKVKDIGRDEDEIKELMGA